MASNKTHLEEFLHHRLRTCVRVRMRDDGVAMLDTPFTFSDGDHFSIYLQELRSGKILLSDHGHTMMHLSYEHNVDSFYKGDRAELREQIVRDCKIKEDDGVFFVEISREQLGTALIRFGQALTRIYDLSMVK